MWEVGWGGKLIPWGALELGGPAELSLLETKRWPLCPGASQPLAMDTLTLGEAVPRPGLTVSLPQV